MTKCSTSISRRAIEKVKSIIFRSLFSFCNLLAPGQMKTQKEATALRLQIEEIKRMQQEQMRKAREDEMRREGIPISKSDRDAYSDRRYTKRDDRERDRGGRGGDRGRDRRSRDRDRRRSRDRDDRRGDRDRDGRRGDRDRGDRDDRRGGGREERSRDRSRDRGRSVSPKF